MEGLWHGLEVVACGWRVGGMDWMWWVSGGGGWGQYGGEQGLQGRGNAGKAANGPWRRPGRNQPALTKRFLHKLKRVKLTGLGKMKKK